MHVSRAQWLSVTDDIINCYTFNRALNRGRVQGIGTVRPDRNDPVQYCITYRNIIAFKPGGERDGPGEREDPGEMEHRRMREFKSAS